MVQRFLQVITLTAVILCTGCTDSDTDSALKPAKPGLINVALQDGETALLSIDPLDNTLQYVWYKDGTLFEMTEQPQCTVNEAGLYKVAGENEAGVGEFSDEVEVKFPEPDPDNLLTPELVPDAVFRSWLNTNLAGGSGFYSISDAAAYEGEIFLEGRGEEDSKIESLQGIEYFTSLKKLTCGDWTALTTIEHILQLSSLEYLYIRFSNCTEFDLTPLTNLEEAHIIANSACQPDGLKVAGLSNLRSLTCDNNNLESLDLTGCSALKELVCSYNSLSGEGLILPETAPLSTLATQMNKTLTELDLSRFASTLTFLNVGNTGLKAIDLTGMTLLEDLDVEGCGMTSGALIGLSECTALKYLRIDSNGFDELDVSTLTNLEMLRCDFNKLKTMDLSNNTKIQELSFQDNELSSISLAGLTQCWYMNLSQNALERVDLTPCVALEQFFCNGNKLKEQQNKQCEIKIAEEYDVDRLNSYDFSTYCDEIGKYFYSYDGTCVFVHEFTSEE